MIVSETEGADWRTPGIAIYRRGTEFVVVPRRLRLERGREAIDSVHPTTGDEITFYIDEVETIEVIRDA